MSKTRPRGVARTVWKEYRKHSGVPLPRRRYIKKRDRQAFKKALHGGISTSSAAVTASAAMMKDDSSTANDIQKAAYMEFPSKCSESLDMKKE